MISSIERKFNLKVQDLKHIFNYILKDKYDSLCVDETRPLEYRLRKNIYDVINI